MIRYFSQALGCSYSNLLFTLASSIISIGILKMIWIFQKTNVTRMKIRV